jgi:vesicle-fusing ATPase
VPPEGRKLLVLGTTSLGAVMAEMELASAFNVVLHVPMLREAQIATVMADLAAFAPQDVRIPALAAPLNFAPCCGCCHCTCA